MRRFSFGLLTTTLSVLLASLILTGCGGKKEEDDDDLPSSGKKKITQVSGGSTLKPVTAKEYGVIRGKVLWQGDPPNFDEMTKKLQAGMLNDKDYCLTGKKKDDPADLKSTIKDYETFQQSYRIGANKGLGNVFVWIVPEKDHYFEIPADQLDKYKNSEVLISQPHCAFLPHAEVLFPFYYKNGKLEPTGQKLLVENDARVSHNSKVAGGPLNPARDQTLAPGGKNTFVLKPERGPITVSCGVHGWMKAYLRAFAHPYAAVTSVGADLAKKQYEETASPKYGTYEITGVPVGAKVNIVVWHEELGYFAGDTGRPLTIKKENVEDFEAKAK